MSRKRSRRRQQDATNVFDSFLFKFSSKAFLGLIIVVAFLTLAQCTVKKPEAPSWNTNLIVPLVNRTYPMEEIVQKIDQEGLQMDSEGNVTYALSEDLDTVGLEPGDLSTTDLGYAVSETLGIIRLDAPTGDVATHQFAGISQLTLLMSGDEATVPATNFSVGENMAINAVFSSATVAEGQALVEIVNNLGLDLDTIIVSVVDNYFGLIASDTLPDTLYNGSTDTAILLLDGRTISNSWRVDAYCHTPGGYVTGISTRYIETGLDFGDSITVSAAVAEIPPLVRNFSEQVALDESDRVDTAVLASGQLSLILSNNTSLDADLTLSLPDFILSGAPITVNQTVAANQTENVAIDLADCLIVPSDNTVPQLLDISVVADIPGSGSNRVPIDQADSIAVQADLTSLTFRSVTGVFDSISASFDGVQEQIDVPTGFDSVQIQVAVLNLEVENRIDLPGYLDARLTGNHGNYIELSGAIEPAGDSFSTTTFTLVDSANFLAPIPSEITASGQVTFGDGVYQGKLEDNDYIFAHIDVTAPLHVVIPQCRVETDITGEEIDQEDIDKITDHVLEAKFVYNIINHLPAGAAVTFYMGPDSANLFSNYQLRVPKDDTDTIFVVAAPVDALGLVSDTASTGYREITLDSLDMQILKNETLYIGQELLLESSGGIPVKFIQSDYFKVIGRIEVEYRFDGDL
ncbi:MAG: hypothetical protein OEW00_07460 [candidate division Zixibacteria bacterium]|nr:hypothetical protein [candidate division Zixibacteria bacterium]